jgi:outer membrane beta-barrel protein
MMKRFADGSFYGDCKEAGSRWVTLLVCVSVLFSSELWAQTSGPVRNSLYDLSGRFELKLAPAVSVFDKYNQQVAFTAGLLYFFDKLVAWEFEYGYSFVRSDTTLFDDVVSVGAENITGIERLPLSHLKKMTWWLSTGLVINPIYGKLNFFSALEIRFCPYFLLGVGASEFRYTELRWQDEVHYSKHETNVGTKAIFHFGVGARVFVDRKWSLLLEIRDRFFHDEYQAQVRRPGEKKILKKSLSGFEHLSMVSVGVSYYF